MSRFEDFLFEHPRFVVAWVTVGGTVLLVILVTQIIPLATGAHENFQTLRSDLAKVRLPSGYRLTAVRRAGTDCAHNECSLTQTWTWASAAGRTKTRACSDVYHAMTNAFSGVDVNGPGVDVNGPSAGAACDYDAVLGSVIHPSQGKRSIEATVQTDKAHTSAGFVVNISATYY